MASAAKVTTGLTRLAVAKNPHHTLGVFYSKSLRALAKMPTDYAYRKHTEQIILERAEMVKSTKVNKYSIQRDAFARVGNILNN